MEKARGICAVFSRLASPFRHSIYPDMDISLITHKPDFPRDTLDDMASLWNRNAVDRHGFFPWSGERLALMFGGGIAARSRLVAARAPGGELAGFAHVTWMREYGYSPGGSVEALLVARPYRNRGVGTALLAKCLDVVAADARDLALVDALGAWPYGYLYTTLADGSERSGVFADAPELAALFRRFGFRDARKSLVMRAATHAAADPLPNGWTIEVARREMTTWLDLAFRGRAIWDHNLVDGNGNVLSRAIYGFMPNESRHSNRTIYSLFGVNTPPQYRSQGYAGRNVSRLLAHLNKLGADTAELHVYADNDPALALYAKTGFRQVAETMMMIKSL